jgi:hypothetical protein
MRDKASATVSVGLNVNNPDVMILFVVKSKKTFGPRGFPEMIPWRVTYRKHEAEDYPSETKKVYTSFVCRILQGIVIAHHLGCNKG